MDAGADRTGSTGDAATALTAWGNAWLAGHVGLDEAVDAVERAAGPQVVGLSAAEPSVLGGTTGTGAPRAPDAPDALPGLSGDVPLRRALGELRVEGMSALRLAVPVPGDPLGLTGPAAFNRAAIAAGSAVVAVLADRAVGLVPHEDLRGSSYAGVRWEPSAASTGRPDVPSLPEADRDLTMAMREATEALLTVSDVASVPPEIADELMGLRSAGADEPPLAPGYPPRAQRTAARAVHLATVVRLARRMEARGLDAPQMRRRDEALRLLDRAVRRAMIAACDSVFDPVDR
ncbi:hypothetical protein [Actinomadura rupiterrae]|uniref:hypothetical protein n=1 Tax=Actinomadura rupiterrae TaxID=559627 RepID=UPI0020A3ED4F|nr:hypothetical protein [Actinomadura rupiterrae]MCP2340335.1 hypothetical protein [Actinomadura rupiterrae]